MEAETEGGGHKPRDPEPPGATGAGGPSPGAPRGGVALPTWIFDFWLQN